MYTYHLLYNKTYKINDNISVVIPSVGEILEHEDEYYGLVSAFTDSPIDRMVQLDDVGIDFSEIDRYQLFILLFNEIREHDTSLIIDGVDLNKFDLAFRESDKSIALVDAYDDIVIDRGVYESIARVLRKIHNLEINNKRPANKEAREYMIERARKKSKRNKNKKQSSQLESLIIDVVNTEQFKYDYETVRDLTIYQFNESVRQIKNKVDYDNRMIGVYAGTINVKDLTQDELTWFKHD